MPTATVQSVDRAMALLAEVAHRPAGLVDLAERSQLPISTAARLLATLETNEAIERSSEGVYRIGPAIGSLVDSRDSDGINLSLHTIAHPRLIELSETLGEAACLSVVSGPDVVTLDQVDAPKPVQAENWTGTRVPLHAGGAGIVAMATWPDSDIDDYLSGDLRACSEHTVTDPDAIRARIRRVRREKVIWTHGEYVDGLSSASAAILDPAGRCVGVVYAYGPTYRFPERGKSGDVATEVLGAADTISADLVTHRRQP